MNAADAPAQIVHVRRGLLCVPRGTASPLVVRREAIRVERVRVVADGHEKIARAVEAERAAYVTALIALRRDVQHLLLRRHIQLLAREREARHADDAALV